MEKETKEKSLIYRFNNDISFRAIIDLLIQILNNKDFILSDLKDSLYLAKKIINDSK